MKYGTLAKFGETFVERHGNTEPSPILSRLRPDVGKV